LPADSPHYCQNPTSDSQIRPSGFSRFVVAEIARVPRRDCVDAKALLFLIFATTLERFAARRRDGSSERERPAIKFCNFLRVFEWRRTGLGANNTASGASNNVFAATGGPPIH
jgi:hypothetical protein